jgi:ABC-type transport system substrate-binding protein
MLMMLLLSTLLILVAMPLQAVNTQDEYLFKVTIIAPGNANMVRRQWGQIFANSLRLLGIDAQVVYLGWAGVFDRVLTPPPERVGQTWEDGGFDVQLIGWTPGLIPEPRQLYYGSPNFWAPYGQNHILWNNTENNLILDTFITSTNATVQDQAHQAWQTLWYNEVPCSQIFFSSNPAVVSPELEYYSRDGTGPVDWWLYFNVQSNPEWIKGKSEVVYASTGEIESLIPPLSNSWYDTIIISPLFSGLAQVEADLSDLAYPALLTNWASSENGYKWTFDCRTGVKWHDGADFTADDVVFSLWALMNPSSGSQFVGYYRSVYGDNVKFTFANGTSTTLGDGSKMGNITAVDQYTVEAWLPELALGKPYGYFDPYLLTLANNIIPKHIFEKIPPAQWTDSPFNTGQGEINIPGTPWGTYTGPIGTGPYKWVSFDPVTQLVHLEKFDDYWERTALEAQGLFGVQDYYIKFIADKTPALAALKNDQVDMLDLNYQMAVDIPSIDPAWGTVILLGGTGRQEIGYNNRHPIFGTGVDTPLGQSDPSKAAEAARYIRIAFDYAIPRQLIIDNLLAGYGIPAATPAAPTQAYYNSSVTPRPYDLAKAREYLELAGYAVPGPPAPPSVPSFILGMSTTVTGTYTDPDTDVPIASRDLMLMVTTNNATYNATGNTGYDLTTTKIGQTTTDLSGWYSFTVTPTDTGEFYYYLFDRQGMTGAEWQYLTMLNVSSLQDAFNPLYTGMDTLETQIGDVQNSLNTMTYVAVAALIIAITVGAIAIYLPMKRT